MAPLGAHTCMRGFLPTLQPDYEWNAARHAHRAHGYVAHVLPNGSRVFVDTGSDDVSWKLGGGGWMSTMDDFMRFGRLLMQRDNGWFSEDLKFNAKYGIWAQRPEEVIDAAGCRASPGTAACSQYSMGWEAWWLNG